MEKKSIAAIREELNNTPPEQLQAQIDLYRGDGRKGVQSIVASQEKRLQKYEAERIRIENLCQFEKKYEEYTYICGIDGKKLTHFFDPMLFADDDGKLYCYWGCGAPGIMGVELDGDNPVQALSREKILFAYNPEHVWERLGEYNEDPSNSYVEGCWMYKKNQRYYMTYSAPGTEYSTYCTGCYVSDAPLGKFIPQQRNPVLKSSSGLIKGAGHGSVVDGPGGTLWIFYTCLAGRDHMFERRVGCDPAGFDGNGEFFTAGTSETPQFAPGINPRPELGNSTGWLPLSVGKFTRAGSQTPGRGSSFAVDNNLRTCYEAAEDDLEMVFEVNLKGKFTIFAFRVIWAETNLSYPDIPPGAWQYVVEASPENEGDDNWKMAFDGSDNQTDLLIDYRGIPETDARRVRLKVVGGPAGMRRGITEFTVFGQGFFPDKENPHGVYASLIS